jgi:hypothetical protein
LFPTQQETKNETIEQLLSYKDTCVVFDKRQSNPPCLVKGCSGDFMKGLTVVFTTKHPYSPFIVVIIAIIVFLYTKVCDNKTIGNNVTEFTVLDPNNNDDHECLKFYLTHFGEGEVKHTG